MVNIAKEEDVVLQQNVVKLTFAQTSIQIVFGKVLSFHKNQKVDVNGNKRIDNKDKDSAVVGLENVTERNAKMYTQNADGQDISSQINGSKTVNGDLKVLMQDKNYVVELIKYVKRTNVQLIIKNVNGLVKSLHSVHKQHVQKLMSQHMSKERNVAQRLQNVLPWKEQRNVQLSQTNVDGLENLPNYIQKDFVEILKFQRTVFKETVANIQRNALVEFAKTQENHVRMQEKEFANTDFSDAILQRDPIELHKRNVVLLKSDVLVENAKRKDSIVHGEDSKLPNIGITNVNGERMENTQEDNNVVEVLLTVMVFMVANINSLDVNGKDQPSKQHTKEHVLSRNMEDTLLEEYVVLSRPDVLIKNVKQ